MNIHITVGQRPSRPFLLSVENKDNILEGETEFVSSQTSPFINHVDCVCTQQVYDSIIDKVGSIQSPALIETATSPVYANRLNVYIENGSLKIVA